MYIHLLVYVFDLETEAVEKNLEIMNFRENKGVYKYSGSSMNFMEYLRVLDYDLLKLDYSTDSC
jgi:hypothetical protein